MRDVNQLVLFIYSFIHSTAVHCLLCMWLVAGIEGKASIVPGIRKIIVYWGKLMFRMQSYMSYRWLPDSTFVRAPDFCQASIPSHSQSKGRSCDLKPSQSAHFAPFCLGTSSGLGFLSTERKSGVKKSQFPHFGLSYQRRESSLFPLD